MRTSDDIALRAAAHTFDRRPAEFASVGIANEGDLAQSVKAILNDPSTECFTAYGTAQTWREADFFYSSKDNLLVVVPADAQYQPTVYVPSDGRNSFQEKLIDAKTNEGRPIAVSHGRDELEQTKQQVDAEYFAHAVDDPQMYPPKTEAMADLVQDRQADEQIAANLRLSAGEPATLNGPERDVLMQDRADFYVSNQQQMTMGM